MGSAALPTLVAAIPILTLLHFVALHLHRGKHGQGHFGVGAPCAAFHAVLAAFLVS